ncbi:hypothetical protein VP01_5264g1 [Puccinia sorghi]|uniref:Uncharacterized protein n=1 Tax=Puccinia sorghi TaxID=27349 RepID=A0A0L6UME5_9BASI|nr:hypothetical protein VP01_5264g1 [Puccinia sorghi]
MGLQDHNICHMYVIGGCFLASKQLFVAVDVDHSWSQRPNPFFFKGGEEGGERGKEINSETEEAALEAMIPSVGCEPAEFAEEVPESSPWFPFFSKEVSQ